MDKWLILKEAIESKKSISCIYSGLFRLCCPHTLGRTNGIERVLVYQFGGESSKGLPRGGEWRCMELHKMSEVAITDHPFLTGTQFTTPQTCVRYVEYVIEY